MTTINTRPISLRQHSRLALLRFLFTTADHTKSWRGENISKSGFKLMYYPGVNEVVVKATVLVAG